MICGYTTFELERVPVRERWDRVRARAVASRRDARDDTIARRTTLVPTVRKRARAWLAKLGSRGGDRRRRVGAVGENDARVSSEARVRARLSKRTVMVPHRYPAKTLPTRSDTDSPAPRSSSMRALDASAALATRARSIAAPTPCPPRREARRPGRYAPRRRRRAERSARDLGRCAKKANEEKRRRNVDASFRVRHGGRKTLPSPLWGVFDLFPKAELSNRVFQYFHTACAMVEQRSQGIIW